MDLLAGLNRDAGISIMMVTHEPDMAAFAHRIVLFKDGMVERVQQNKPSAPAAAEAVH
jgi:putative ABC transport system ATP-binding protein